MDCSQYDNQVWFGSVNGLFAIWQLCILDCVNGMFAIWQPCTSITWQCKKNCLPKKCVWFDRVNGTVCNINPVRLGSVEGTISNRAWCMTWECNTEVSAKQKPCTILQCTFCTKNCIRELSTEHYLARTVCNSESSTVLYNNRQGLHATESRLNATNANTVYLKDLSTVWQNDLSTVQQNGISCLY